MILVTVGTTPFNGLVKTIDNLKINEIIIIQKATGTYVPKNCPYFEFSDQIHQYFAKSEIIISHGGAGTLYELLKLGKRIIGVANLERKDTHQTDLLQKLAKLNYIVWCQNYQDIQKSIDIVRNISLTKYESPECNIINKIEKFIK